MNGNGWKRIVPWLPVLTVGFVTAVAWGQQLQTTSEHERRIGINEQIVRDLEKTQATILERVDQTKQVGETTQGMLTDLINTLQRNHN